MSVKREQAKIALQKWRNETSAEMFIEQHKQISFNPNDQTPKVELIKKPKPE